MGISITENWEKRPCFSTLEQAAAFAKDYTEEVNKGKIFMWKLAELRAAGVRVMLRDEADSEAAFLCVTPNTGVDLVMGVGGASQGVMTACIVKAMRGAMLMRLAPQSDEERALLNAVGLDYNRIMTQDDIVKTKQLFIAITGVTNSTLLPEMQYFPDFARTHSYLIRAETGTVRYIKADHAVRL